LLTSEEWRSLKSICDGKSDPPKSDSGKSDSGKSDPAKPASAKKSDPTKI
jgi:hypothetical protein